MSGTLVVDLMATADLSAAQNYNVYDRVIDELEARKLFLPNNPSNGFKGETPKQLTTLSDEELGDLLNNISQWCGFAESELEKAAIIRESSKKQLDFIKARIRIAIKAQHSGKRLTEKDKDDIVETHHKVVEAYQNALSSESYYRLVRVLRDQAQRNWDTVSRRITQRGQQVERMKREQNIGSVPIQSRHFHRPGER